MGKTHRELDDLDRRILRLLQSDARMTNLEVARRLKASPSTVLERTRSLEARGVIRGYTTKLDHRSLGAGLLAFVSVRANDWPSSLRSAKRVARMPEVQEVHHIAGNDSFIVKLRVADTESLSRTLQKMFGTSKDVRSTTTSIVLETLKETSDLGLDGHVSG